jgi:prophage regulatory protein
METQPLLRLPAVIRATGLYRSTIYKLMSEGNFPSSLKLTQRTVAWSSGDIQHWVESRTPTRPAPQKPGRAEMPRPGRQARRRKFW